MLAVSVNPGLTQIATLPSNGSRCSESVLEALQVSRVSPERDNERPPLTFFWPSRLSYIGRKRNEHSTRYGRVDSSWRVSSTSSTHKKVPLVIKKNMADYFTCISESAGITRVYLCAHSYEFQFSVVRALQGLRGNRRGRLCSFQKIAFHPGSGSYDECYYAEKALNVELND
jgi:hypothetical protein